MDIDFVVNTTRAVADVKAAIEREIQSRLPGGRIKRFWEGDVYRLVGMGADGRIEVRPGEIHASAILKAPLSLMKGRVEQGLRETVERAAAAPQADSPQPGSALDALDGVPAAEVEELRAKVDGVVLPGGQAHDEFLT